MGCGQSCVDFFGGSSILSSFSKNCFFLCFLFVCFFCFVNMCRCSVDATNGWKCVVGVLILYVCVCLWCIYMWDGMKLC